MIYLTYFATITFFLLLNFFLLKRHNSISYLFKVFDLNSKSKKISLLGGIYLVCNFFFVYVFFLLEIIPYEHFYKILNKDNSIPKYVRKVQKDISCIMPFLSDYTQKENISSARGSDNGSKISFGQSLFSYLFYGNSKFYDLPNIK